MRFIWVVVFCMYACFLCAQATYSLGGRLFLDGGAFISSPSGFNSGVCIPDLRLTGKSKLGDGWSVKLDVGFASNKVSLKDVFVQKIHNEHHAFRLGYLLGSFSIDQTASSNDYLFMKGANVANVFYPSRRLGLFYTYMLPHYNVLAGVFCGDGLNFDKNIKQGWNATLRFVYRPLAQEDRLLHIGVGGFYKRPDKNIETGEQVISLKSKGVTNLSVPYLLEVSFVDVKDQYQWNAELLGHIGSWFFQAEYMEMYLKRTTGMNYKAKGGYMEGGAFLLGGNFSYDPIESMHTYPVEPNSLAIFGRFNCTDLDDSLYKCGKQYDVSLGVNYYMNKNIAFRVNYSCFWTNENALIADETWNMLQARVQVKF